MTSSSNLKNHHISILYYWNKGIRAAPAIHRETKIPLRTIYYNINKLKQTNSLKHRGGNGRPRVLSEIEKIAIGQYIRRNNEITINEIKEKLSTTYRSTVSASIIRRHLHRCGYRNILPRKTHILTVDDKQKRVQWAKKHKDDDFTHTIFTDESSFQLYRNTVRRWSKCPHNEVKPIPKNRQKVHVWGALSTEGVLNCHTFKCNLDGEYYVNILKNYLLPAARRQFHRNWRLQQDNDPKHRSNICKKFIHDYVPELLDWPSNSPDVNPIENIWSIVKRKVEKRKPKNIDELERFLVTEFKNMDINIVNNCVMSMRDRCLSLISSKGERIKY
jgi:transposase